MKQSQLKKAIDIQAEMINLLRFQSAMMVTETKEVTSSFAIDLVWKDEEIDISILIDTGRYYMEPNQVLVLSKVEWGPINIAVNEALKQEWYRLEKRLAAL